MNVGDKVRVDGMSGIVVAVISEGKFTPAFPAEEWAYLKAGILVETTEAGLIHISDMGRVSAEPNSN